MPRTESDGDSLMSSERRRKVLERINARRSITVLELAEAFPVSAITIRRDLDRLAADHLIERVHGGAMALEAIAVAPRASEQSGRLSDEQLRIGREAARRVRDGDYLVLESGSTCLAMVAGLAEKKDLRVLTVSPRIVTALANLVEKTGGAMEIICSGGVLNVYKNFLMGPHSRILFEESRVDAAFISPTAVDLEAGITADSMAEAEITRTILTRCARCRIGLAVSRKFGRTSFARIAPAETFDEIITDSGIEAEVAQKFRDRGITVTIV
jgi:DeoR/GlpR family transcriptional regulator of sugar metabolism